MSVREPDLCKGMTLAHFRSLGNIPCLRESFIRPLKTLGIVVVEFTCFRAAIDESAVALFSKELIIVFISCGVVGDSSKFSMWI